MQDTIVNLPNSEVKNCSMCGSKTARVSFETQKFNYGRGDDAVELTAHVPVWTCDACGDQYTDHVAEDLRHGAVCKHLGRLRPDEIAALRKAWNLTQAEWADLTGFGIASIKRWEAGNLIQGVSSDKFMRLLKEHKNIYILKQLASQGQSEPVKQSRFKTELSREASLHASVFQLRRTHLVAKTA